MKQISQINFLHVSGDNECRKELKNEKYYFIRFNLLLLSKLYLSIFPKAMQLNRRCKDMGKHVKTFALILR